MTTPEEAKDVIRRWNEEGWSGGKYDLAHEIIAPVMTVHGAGGQTVGMGPDGLIELIKAWRTGFPDGYMTIDELIVEGDLVGIRNTWHGTHTGTFYGIPPSGNRVAVTSVGLDRVRDGQVVEGWGELDMIGMMQQLGAMPMVGPGAVSSGRDAQWGPTSTFTAPATTSPSQNKDLLLRFLERLGEGADQLDDLADPSVFVDHNPSWGTQDLAGVSSLGRLLRGALPDLAVSVDRDTAVAEGDLAEAHSLWGGTHTGAALFGAEPSGAEVRWTQSDLVRVAAGRIVERWTSADTMTLFQQVGLLPSG